MKIIHKKYDAFERLPPQKIDGGKCRKTIYSVSTQVEDGMLLYPTLTREVLLLNHQECAEYEKGELGKNLKIYLVENWFLVPEEFDEAGFYKKVYEDILGGEPRRGRLELATVFTTTACNARCPYCYESGVKPVTMSKEVAVEAARYIASRMDNHVHLKWFGGEPLLNPEAMNIICEYLMASGAGYNASMTTNGYLVNEFDKHTIRDVWKINNVQITLDGMPDTYSRVKAYKNGDSDAFDRVIRNIEYLSDIGVHVQIRMNLSADNGDEIKKLILYLEERFAKTPRVVAYTNPLFEGCGKPAHKPTAEERERIYEKYLELEKHISKGPLSNRYALSGLRSCQCMADNGHSACILPDGRLSLCEHHCEDETFGTIWDRDRDYDESVFERWKEKEDRSDNCSTCFYYPQCFRLKHCETNPPCTDGLRRFYKFCLEEQAIRAYKRAAAIENQDTHVLCCKWNTMTPD